jgi:hypothetical protein
MGVTRRPLSASNCMVGASVALMNYDFQYLCPDLKHSVIQRLPNGRQGMALHLK